MMAVRGDGSGASRVAAASAVVLVFMMVPLVGVVLLGCWRHGGGCDCLDGHPTGPADTTGSPEISVAEPLQWVSPWRVPTRGANAMYLGVGSCVCRS